MRLRLKDDHNFPVADLPALGRQDVIVKVFREERCRALEQQWIITFCLRVEHGGATGTAGGRGACPVDTNIAAGVARDTALGPRIEKGTNTGMTTVHLASALDRALLGKQGNAAVIVTGVHGPDEIVAQARAFALTA